MFGHTYRRGALLAAIVVALIAACAATVIAVDVPIATVPAGNRPNSVAVNPLSHNVYVGNLFGDRFSIIDATTDSVVTSFPVGNVSCMLLNTTVSPARAYIGDFQHGWLYVVDDSTRSMVATITGFGGMVNGPRALALEPANNKLYLAEYGNDRVAVLDGSTYEVLSRIPVGDAPRALGVYSSKTRKRVFVANRGSGNVTVIDARNDTIAATVTVGSAPKAIAVNTGTGVAYVTNEASDTVSVINTSDALAATVAVGDRPIGIAVDEVGGRVFIANFNSNNVTVMRTSNNTIEATVTVQGGPWGVALDPGTRKVYVSNATSGTVSVIDSALAVTTVAAQRGPFGIGIDTGFTPAKVYVANETSNSVTVIQDNGASVPRASSARAAESVGIIDVTVDPATPGVLPSVITGSATSNRPAGFEAAVVAVWVRVDGGAWQHAAIAGGADTTSVTWSLDVGSALPEGSHTVEVLAFDETGAAAATSDAGSAAQNPMAGGRSLVTLDVVGALPTVTTLSAVEPPNGPVRALAVAVKTADGVPVPSGVVVVQRWTVRGWRYHADAILTAGGTAIVPIRTSGTYRAHYLGDTGYAESWSEPFVVRTVRSRSFLR